MGYDGGIVTDVRKMEQDDPNWVDDDYTSECQLDLICPRCDGDEFVVGLMKDYDNPRIAMHSKYRNFIRFTCIRCAREDNFFKHMDMEVVKEDE